jgi:tetratricopeptide (TPR) repeat protein
MHLRPLLIISCLTALGLLDGCGGPTQAGLQARAEARERLGAYTAQFTYDQARQEFESGQFDHALRDIERAIQQAPDVAEFDLLKGRIHLEAGDLEPAVEAFAVALEKDPELAEAHYYTGIVLQRWSDDEQAFDHYRQAYELEHENVQYLLATAETLIALGEFGEAKTMVEARMAYFEHDPALRHLLGQIALLEDDPATAARYYEEARLLDPDNLTLLEELAWARYDAAQYGQCLETVCLLQDRLEEPRSDLLHLEARCLAMLDRATEAHSRFMTLTKLVPDDETVWIEFGTLAWRLGDYRRMVQCSVRAIELAPDRFEGYMLKGLYERQQGRGASARQLMQQAADRAKDDVLPHLLLGRMFEEDGELRAALDAYASALQINPDSPEVQALYAHAKEQLRVATAE